MPRSSNWDRGLSPAELDLSPDAAEAMRAELPKVAEAVVGAIRAEVPSYADPFKGEMGRTIENAVALALGGFLGIASGQTEGSASFAQVADAAYALGRGEARGGRTMEALLNAYRVGARIAWRDMSGSAVATGLPALTIARFAELVFAYIDELSAASAAGHADELATTGRVRQRYLERLTQHLLRGGPPDALVAAAERADWEPPRLLTVVILPESRSRGVLAQLGSDTLQPTEQVPGLEERPDLTVLLVPGSTGSARTALIRSLAGRDAVVGPSRPWLQVQSSYDRALRVVGLDLERTSPAPVDTEEHLSELILGADDRAMEDLRLQVLEPLAELRPAVVEKLTETLRSWLLHQGRRDEVAAELFVHPQTVRYRMQQLRELYGDRLSDPDWLLRLTIALA
ncbi:MAG: Transcriptional regulator, CdaR-family [uncultured Nocardioidaceae bacterium]|uniref:Transcriptional regulator, CdaR-family n=1 Tax=uncultured Nocardioidaceae bacterium TaxID=253824 RepID=A0A6J4N0D4_9ACTN|nr:MAG: Transcriptional regulator, CdaR-family [uncultured Nocardioidaceae bacterium]